MDALAQYCKKWHVIVNAEKSKIMIFSRGRQKSQLPEFTFEGDAIETVHKYKYLGVAFSSNNGLIDSIKENKGKGLRAMFALLSNCKRLHLPYDVSLELFDKTILPILLYGCEVWGYNDTKILQRVQTKFYKLLFNLYYRTSTSEVLSKAGRFPLSIDIKK